MVPREACHYTKTDTVFKILETKELRISQFKFTNDPRESKERNAALVWITLVSSPSDGNQKVANIRKGRSSFSYNHNEGTPASQIIREANRIALEEWKVLCVTLHRPSKTVAHIGDEVYNHSIRHGYSRPRMWAQYAENHKGVCIIFDAGKLNGIIHDTLGSQCKIFQGRVSYDYKSLVYNTIPVNNPQASIVRRELINELRQHYFSNHKVTFLIKHPDWRDETEYRWVLHSPQKSNLYVPIKDSIKSILIGVDYPKVRERRLIKLCRELRISLGKIEWDDGIALARLGSIYRP